MRGGVLFSMKPELLKAQEDVENLRIAFEKANFENLAMSSLDNEDKYASVQNLVGEEGMKNQKTVNLFAIALI